MRQFARLGGAEGGLIPPARWLLLEPLLAALLWGGVFTAAKLALREIPPLSYIIVRLVIAGGLLALLAVASPRGRSFRIPIGPLLAAGVAQVAFQWLLFEGIARTTAGVSAILLATAPLMTALWIAASRKANAPVRQWIGLALGLVGVALVVRTDSMDLAGATLVGNLLALGSAVAWASYGITIGPVARAVGPVAASAWTLCIAGVVLVPLGLSDAFAVDWRAVSISSWVAVLYGSVLGLVLATLLWVRSIERFGVQPTMNYGYVEPVAAVMIAAAMLGESMRPIQGIGAVLALLGVYFASAQGATARLSSPPGQIVDDGSFSPL